MQKKLKIAVLALCCTSLSYAQDIKDTEKNRSNVESGFTFTEAQLDEDESRSQDITIIGSSSNVYASQVGFLFSPVRFRYRALNQKFNEIYINGTPMNDMEAGNFRYPMIGGLNNLTRGMESSLPFETNNFSMPGMAGSANYNFRPTSLPAGHRMSIMVRNSNYTMRGMYTFNTGVNKNGWAFAGNLTYRWADRGYVEGTFYNALSYYLGAQKLIGNNHSLTFATWGNPTERASQGAATDESYWIANNYQYNPYWGYQNGKRRNSRVVNDFAPTAMFTWDWNINDDTKLTTSVFGKYSMYKSTKLNYNNAENPQPDYWKNLPSSFFDVWDVNDEAHRGENNYEDWKTAYDYLKASKANRQINWDRLYAANRNGSTAENGADAMYYIQAKNNDALTLKLSSTLSMQLDKNSKWNLGFTVGTNSGRHYQTLEDLLGAHTLHNINTYAKSSYASNAPEIHYDLNTRGNKNEGRELKEGDKFGYDYFINVNKASVWTNYSRNMGRVHMMAALRGGGISMQREGKMRNGMAPNNSYGKSKTAHFGELGGKLGFSFNLGGGNTVSLGAGYEWRAPLARTAFVSPEINNDFVSNLKNERIFSSEIGYQLQTQWVRANINAYYNHMDHVTEWQNFYFDDINSFSYVSMTGLKKEYYGIEYGLDFKLSSDFNLLAIGQYSEAKNINNADVSYMNSTKKTIYKDVVYNKDMRESGTPLSSHSLILSYHSHGWFIDLKGNYYDRIYLGYSPSMRYGETLERTSSIDNEGNYIVPEQAKGKGGFMLDASIGRSIYLKKGQLSINMNLTNILNNIKICTGGYEQSRSDYTVKSDGTMNNQRTYKFSKNPKKYYAYGTNGMLIVTYKF